MKEDIKKILHLGMTIAVFEIYEKDQLLFFIYWAQGRI